MADGGVTVGGVGLVVGRGIVDVEAVSLTAVGSLGGRCCRLTVYTFRAGGHFAGSLFTLGCWRAGVLPRVVRSVMAA